MPARPLQRSLKVLLGRRGGARASRQHDKLGFDALELRDGSMLLVGSGERLVDRRESLRDLPDPGQAFRQLAKQGDVVWDEADLAELVERGAQPLDAGADIAAPDAQDAGKQRPRACQTVSTCRDEWSSNAATARLAAARSPLQIATRHAASSAPHTESA